MNYWDLNTWTVITDSELIIIELKKMKKLYNNRQIEVNPIKIEKYKKYVKREKVQALFKDRQTKEEILSLEKRGK